MPSATVAIDQPGVHGAGIRLTPTVVMFALVSAAATYVLVAHGWLLGAPVVALLVTAVVLVPSAAHLSARLALNGAFALTVAPVIASVPLPVTINPGALLAAGATAAMVVSVRFGRPVLPEFSMVDSLPPVAACVAVAAMKAWLSVRTTQGALELLLPGYDYSGHFDIFELLRHYGRSIPEIGSGPDGTPVFYRGYPTGYHALCAAFANLFEQRSDSLADLPVFAVVNGVVVVAACLVLLAGLCSIPLFRAHFGYAAIATFFVLCVVLLGIGASTVSNGFVNFWLASVFVSLAMFLALYSDGPWFARVLVTQALLLGGAFAWAPLAVLGLPAVILLHRGRPARCRTTKFLWVLLMLGVVPLAQISFGAQGGVVATLNNEGGFLGSLALLVASFLVILATLVLTAFIDCKSNGEIWRILPRRPGLVLLPLGGLVMVLGLGVFQLITGHGLSYYFFKLVAGLDLVLGAVLVAVLAPLAALSGSEGVIGRVLASPKTGVAFIVGLGLAFTGLGSALGPGMHQEGTTVFRNRDEIPRVATAVLGAVHWDLSARASGSVDVMYVPLGKDKGPNPQAAEQWFMALSGTFTERGASRQDLVGQYRDAREAAFGLTKVVHDSRNVLLLVPPGHVQELESALRSLGVRARVVSW